jgi:GT2 family glycosyltransferase
MAQLSVVIINYNTFDLTSDCIRSVIACTKDLSYEIIVVDNASTADDPDRFLVEFPRITLIKSERNGGFAYGNNLGIRKAKAENILLLNSDTLLKEDTLSKCMEYLKTRLRVGVLGCRMIYPDGTVQYSARKFRSVGWELLDLFRFIPLMMPYKARSKKMLGKYFRHDESIECDWVNGAFFLFRARILEGMPGKKLDERFFMYGEDQLWCEQAKKQGYTILFYADTTIVHIHGGSTQLKGQLKLRRTMMEHELDIMRLRKGRGLYYYTFKAIYVTKESARNLVKRIAYKLTGKLIR